MARRRTAIQFALLGLLCLAFTGQAQQLKPGILIEFRKDTATTNLIRKTIVDVDTLGLFAAMQRKVDSLITARGGGGIDADSVRRLSIRYTFVAQLGTILNSDTSSTFYFGDADTYGLANPTDLYSITTAHTTLIPYSIHISHRWDDGIRRARDTTFYYTVLDSIPRNSSLWLFYDPAFGGAIAGGYQKFALAKGAQHANSVSVMSSNPVQVPLILKPGTGQVGMLPDHWYNVTLILIEKVPGKKYW